MSESRYRSVCVKELSSFAPSCPVQITKYEILYDSMYDRAVTRVTLKNISSKAVKTAYVCAQCFDDAGDDLGSTGDFALMDVNLEAGKEVSPETDILLTDRNVSSINVKISKLVYADASVFRNENASLIELPEQTVLSNRYPNYAQIKRECKGVVTPVFVPDTVEGAWRCTCGAINLDEQDKCVACSVERAWLDEHFDSEYLENAAEQYEVLRYEEKCAPIYEAAMNPEKSISGYREAANKLWTIADYKDSKVVAEKYTAIADQMTKELAEKQAKEQLEREKAEKEAENQRLAELYEAAKPKEETEKAYLDAAAAMKELSGYADSAKLAKVYKNKAKQIVKNQVKATPKDDRVSKYTREEYLAHLEKVDYWKRNIAITVVCFALVAVMSVLYYFFVHEPITQNNIYQNAVTLIETKTAKGYCEASVILRELGDYKDAKEQLKKISLEITDGERDDAYLTTSEEMYYLQLSDTTAGLITYDSERYTFKSDLIIPDYLDGYKVTAIDAQACQNAKELTKLTLPKTLVSIGDAAFKGCVNLKEVNLSELSVRSLGNNAFDGCTSLTSIELPKSLRTIGKSCFANCTSLTTAKLSDGMSEIPSGMFSKCSALTSVVFPEKVKIIEDNAFYQCSSLTELALPHTVHTINDYAFYKCAGVKSIDLYPAMTTVAIYAFDLCTSLETINYYGTEDGFNKIFIDRNNDPFENASVVYKTK